MSIFIMDSKTLMKKYIKQETKRTVTKTQYVIISNTISTRGTLKNVIRANIFYPDTRLISDLMMQEISKTVFMREYLESIRELYGFFAPLIDISLEGENIILLCNTEEWSYGYMDMIAEMVYDYYGYIIREYDGDLDEITPKKDRTIISLKVLAEHLKMDRLKEAEVFKDKEDRKELAKIISKKEMIGYLYQIGLAPEDKLKKMPKEKIKKYFKKYFVNYLAFEEPGRLERQIREYCGK